MGWSKRLLRFLIGQRQGGSQYPTNSNSGEIRVAGDRTQTNLEERKVACPERGFGRSAAAKCKILLPTEHSLKGTH